MDELQREVLTQRILRILNHQASETVANDIDRLQQTSGGLEDEGVQLSRGELDAAMHRRDGR